MATLKAGVNNPLTTFNLNGRDYPKGIYTFYYQPTEVNGSIEDWIGIRNKYDPNWSLIRPIPYAKWLDETSSPYTSLNELIADLSSLLGFNSASGGSGAITQSATNFAALLDGIVTGEIAYVFNSQGTAWLPSTLGGTYYPEGFYVWDGAVWVSDRNAISNQLYLQDVDYRVIVNQGNVATTLGGVIDSTKEYLIDGIIDMGTTQITVPATGMTLKGFSFDISGLTSSANNYTMFISGSVGGDGNGSGNLLGQDYFIEVTGTSSKVYELYDDTGFNAFEFIRVNYNNCTSLGDIFNYRQGLENGTGRFGGSPSLTLHGLWRGGYRITTSIVRSMSNTTTVPLFREGTAFQMNSRFLTDINCDLGALQPFTDFTQGAFPNESTIQFKGVIMTRGGIVNNNDTNITPNLLPSNISCDWDNNVGMNNTFIGGAMRITAQTTTTIGTAGVFVDMEGTWTPSDLQHFDSTGSNQLRHIGNDPRDFRVTFDMVIEGGSGDVINNAQGGRDVAYFNGTFSATISNNEYVVWQVANLTDTSNVTVEVDSAWIIEER